MHTLDERQNGLGERRWPLEFFAAAAAIFTLAAVLGPTLATRVDGPLVAVALSADLALLVPALYYWLAVRRRGWPAFSTVPVFLLCLVAASRIIPPEHHGLLDSLYLAVPILELGVLSAIVVALVRASRVARQAGGAKDLLGSAQAASRSVIGEGRVAEVLAYELAILFHAFGPRHTAPSAGFTYHRKTAFRAYTGVLLLVTAAEIVPVHLLLERWWPAFAWCVLALTLYGAVWIVGDARAMTKRPIRVDGEALRLRFGLRWSLDLPWPAIDRLEPFRPSGRDADADVLTLVPMGAGANLRATLRRPVEAVGPYGLRKSISEIHFVADEPAALLAACAPYRVEEETSESDAGDAA